MWKKRNFGKLCRFTKTGNILLFLNDFKWESFSHDQYITHTKCTSYQNWQCVKMFEIFYQSIPFKQNLQKSLIWYIFLISWKSKTFSLMHNVPKWSGTLYKSYSFCCKILKSDWPFWENMYEKIYPFQRAALMSIWFVEILDMKCSLQEVPAIWLSTKLSGSLETKSLYQIFLWPLAKLISNCKANQWDSLFSTIYQKSRQIDLMIFLISF